MRPLLIVGGAGVYAVSTYFGYHLYSLSKLPQPEQNCHLPQNQPHFQSVYDFIAHDYDSKVGYDEWMMGFQRLREKLLGPMANGRVLEISAGTGRNLDFYNPKLLSSLILTDSSLPMIKFALEKFNNGEVKNKYLKENVTVKFTKMNSDELLYDDNYFDTVVDTFGLCSHSDPVKSLKVLI